MSRQDLQTSLKQYSDTINHNCETSKSVQINYNTLLDVIGKMLCKDVISATWQTKQLQGGTIGNVQLVSGTAKIEDGNKLPYSVVLKTQKKWERYGDENSWRREYDLYLSRMDTFFSDEFRWPRCYHAQLYNDKTQLWMEYINGVSGTDMVLDMCEQAAEALGRFQGKIYTQRPAILQTLSNLSDVDYIKNYYKRYRSWDQVYDYIRAEACPIPKHICNMLIELDEQSESVWEQIERLPVVICHRDFWITNIIYAENYIHLIDWDTAGWGHLGEDIASLISDELDVNHMVECYTRCVPAYYKGFSEYADVSSITDNCIYELILVMFGYRLIEWYKFSESAEEKQLHLMTLQKIYEIGLQSKKAHPFKPILDLQDYGFSPTMILEDVKGIPARVTAVHKERYELVCQFGQIYAKLKSGVYYNEQPVCFPTTGDFVLIQYNDTGDSLILKTLERVSKFSRNDFSGHAVGYVKSIKEQVVASNFDYVFIMASLNHDFNLSRIERYLTLAWESGGIPVIVLTKSDLVDDYTKQVESVQRVAVNVPVHTVSAKTGHNIDLLSSYTKPGKTIVLLGSSGVGKSSLVNVLAEKDLMAIKEIREDDSRGRHTTTHRQLIMLPSGGMIIDTPGMRELGMWHVTEGLNEAFADVESHLGKCKFSDCRHESEPGCAIKKAIQNGSLSQSRWNSYLQIQSEAKFVNDKSKYLREKDAKNKSVAMLNKRSKRKK